MTRVSTARAIAHDVLQAEFAADERRAIEARGGVAPHPDGSPKCVVQGQRDGTYRCRCSCGFEGTNVAADQYRIARDEMVAHKRSCK